MLWSYAKWERSSESERSEKVHEGSTWSRSWISRILKNKNETKGRIGREGTKSNVFIIASNNSGRESKTESLDNKTKN